MQISEHNGILSFSNVNSGYLIKDKYNYIKGFEIAGADKIFHYAQATIENNKVIVHSDSVTTPTAVRYGWADDAPEANLYNRDGFPTAPFRTDNWEPLTAGNKYKIE
ncbi:MAG: 9-O-acetylesterase, partial [Ginsengibacter sp.]